MTGHTDTLIATTEKFRVYRRDFTHRGIPVEGSVLYLICTLGKRPVWRIWNDEARALSLANAN